MLLALSLLRFLLAEQTAAAAETENMSNLPELTPRGEETKLDIDVTQTQTSSVLPNNEVSWSSLG
jgi:hypothetical protein